jgi:hypothetical protein
MLCGGVAFVLVLAVCGQIVSHAVLIGFDDEQYRLLLCVSLRQAT